MPSFQIFNPIISVSPVSHLVSDRGLVRAILEVEKNLARSQSSLGLIPEKAAEVIAQVTENIEIDIELLAQESCLSANPIVKIVEYLSDELSKINRDYVKYLHRGSTSQDILDTAIMLLAKEVMEQIITDLHGIEKLLYDLSLKYKTTPIAARTLALHAVPTTFGLKTAYWLMGIQNCLEQLQVTKDEQLLIQLGGAAGTLSAYIEAAEVDTGKRIDKTQFLNTFMAEFSSRTGLANPQVPWQCVRTPIMALATSLAMLTSILGKIATDVITMSRSEIAEIEESTDIGKGESSTMPQKKNPVLSTLIKTAALQCPNLVATILTTSITPDERSAGEWHAEWLPLSLLLSLSAGATTTTLELIKGLVLHPERMENNLSISQGTVNSEKISIRLAPILGKKESKQILQAASFEAAKRKISLESILLETPEITNNLKKSEIIELTNPKNYLGAAEQIIDRISSRYSIRK